MFDLAQVPAGFPGLRELSRGESVDETPIGGLLSFVDARLDCADFRALTACKLALDHRDQLSAAALASITASLRRFKYWLDEPGIDSMCYWSENHLVVFATAEYLAGGLYPDAVFSNAAITGREHRDKGRRRLTRWLADRQRFGFSEWLSNTYYEEDVAALALLVDHAEPALARSATATLDQLMGELAAHSSGGVLGASSGRCYEQQKKFPATAQVTGILAHAFGIGPAVGALDWRGLSALFYTSTYRAPREAIELANSRQSWTTKTSYGIDLADLKERLAGRSAADFAEFAWAMEAFVNPQTVCATSRLMAKHQLHDNSFLSPLRALERVPRSLQPTLIRLANPVALGMALQRADVTTWRGVFGTLSSAQRYHPGEFGDQQQIWQATLGEVGVFATHPGASRTASTRNATPNYWVGNGINPDVAQQENLLVARYDTRGRRGVFEPPRQRLSHLYWPTARFEESVSGRNWVAARVNGGLIGIRAASDLRQGEEDELVQVGAITGWAVRVQAADGSAEEVTRFTAELADSALFVDGSGLRWFSVWGALELAAGGSFTVDGRAQDASEHRPRASAALAR